MSQKYFFRFTSITRLAFSDWAMHQIREQNGIKNNYIIDEAVMLAFDKRIKKDNFFHHYGLGFDVEIKAKSKNEARNKAETLILNFIGTLCFLEKSYIEPPKYIFSYRFPKSGSTTLSEYHALLFDNNYYQPNERTLRPINCGNFNYFLNKLLSVNSNLREEIYFSLHWLWKATGVTDKRDMFINLWVALEILENSLKKHYNLPESKTNYPICKHCNSEFDVCPECKKEFSYKASSGFVGIKKLQEDIKIEKLLKFSQLHTNRSKLIHSGGNLSNIEIDQSIFSTRVLINCAILTLLNFENAISDGILMAGSKLRLASQPIIMEFEGEIKLKAIPKIDENEKQPSIDAKYSYNYKIKNGELITSTEVLHCFNENFDEGKVEKMIKTDGQQKIKELWEISN